MTDRTDLPQGRPSPTPVHARVQVYPEVGNPSAHLSQPSSPTHRDVIQALDKLRASARRYERSVYLGAPLTAAMVYERAMQAVASLADVSAATHVVHNRDGLSAYTNRILAHSKNCTVDRVRALAVCSAWVTLIDTWAATAKVAQR